MLCLVASHVLYNCVIVIHNLTADFLIFSHVYIEFDVSQAFLTGVNRFVELFHIGKRNYWSGSTQVIRHTDDVHWITYGNLTLISVFRLQVGAKAGHARLLVAMTLTA